MSWNELLFDFVTFWVTVDPIGTVPLYLSVTKDMTTAARKRAAMRATLIAFFLLAGFPLSWDSICWRRCGLRCSPFKSPAGLCCFSLR